MHSILPLNGRRLWDTTNFLTYTNTDLGFTIKYPSGWTVENADTITHVVPGIVFSSSDKSYRVLVEVQDMGGASFNDLSTYFSQHTSEGDRLLEFNSNNYLLSGHPAFRTITIESLGSVDMKAYGTVVADKGYVINFITTAERFPIFLQTAQPMIDSFQIISKQ
jgi:hypothetical protein